MVGCGKMCVADFCMKECFICYSLKKEMKKTKQKKRLTKSDTLKCSHLVHKLYPASVTDDTEA